MSRKENDLSPKNDGLPEVAQKAQKKTPIIFLMMGMLIVPALGMHFNSKSKTKTAQPVEETFIVNAEDKKLDKAPLLKMEKPTSDISNEAAQSNREITEAQIAFIQQKQKELQERLAAPLMVVNNNEGMSRESEKVKPKLSTDSGDANTRFMNQVSEQKPEGTNATTIGPLSTIVAEGSLIHATLESAANSDLPGFLRASVSESTYSEDGTQVLIPKGSRLIGQYKSGMLQGQSRFFIVWTRLITPDGISISLGSAGVDNLGVAGSGADEIDRHFWARFGTASLLSIIGTGAANAGVSSLDQENSASAYRSGLANNFAESAEQSLQQDKNIPPTLKKYQGKPMMVFVAHDLNFQSALNHVKPKMNVF